MGKSPVVNVLIVGNLWETWRPPCATALELPKASRRTIGGETGLRSKIANPPENSGRSEGTRLWYAKCEREREIELPHSASRQRHSSNRGAPRESPVAMRE